MEHTGFITFFVLFTTMVLFGSDVKASDITAESVQGRTKRTIGSASSFINCITVLDGVDQRFCSYEQPILKAIERVAIKGTEAERKRLPCPPRKTFRKQCNLCECLENGVLTCTVDSCAEDFYDASGLPKYW
ncbi:uncharacterized protein LOC134223574 isoform X2 [Armigeres subalbatus]|uniref:uncharacterized protein LOC134223574 isoform X2 n=1 Tax=Armigeres subalbatus TaxID=124917 RepID=UPI002ECFC5D8